MAKWKDDSSYSRNDPHPRVATVWSLELPQRLRVIVHRHIHVPGVWFLSCHRLGIDTEQLKASELEDAKAEALETLIELVSRFGGALVDSR